MPWILVRHRVSNWEEWKPVFDEHAPARKEVGSLGGYVFRNADEPNEVLVLTEVRALDPVREFARSQDLRQAMERAGVAEEPDIYFLEEADRPEA